jgi:hypothetical protein
MLGHLLRVRMKGGRYAGRGPGAGDRDTANSRLKRESSIESDEPRLIRFRKGWDRLPHGR